MLSGRENLNLKPRFDAYAYQLNAVEEVKDLEYAALFHEQGLGKTKIALDLALQWLEAGTVDSALVITKKGLVKNWEKETRSHTSLSSATFDSNRLRNSYKFNKPYRLYIAHYEAVSGSVKSFSLFLKTRKVGAILDEAHYMKNPKGRIAKAFFHLAELFSRRVIMTGTPVANRPYDLWSQIFFLDQGKSLGCDFESFKSRYDLPPGAPNCVDTAFEGSLVQLFEAIQHFTIRETKQSAGLSLPTKKLHNQTVSMEPQQHKLYEEYREKLRAEVIKDGRLVTDGVENLLKKMLRLVQVASNPRIVDESYDREPGKLLALNGLLSAIKKDEKAVVWTNFIANADYLADRLVHMGSLKLHGKMNMEARNRAVERFLNDPAKQVLVATPGAAKEGLTLTVANHAVFFDRSFSLNDWLQAQDRIHRISQQRTCWVTNLFARDSIDEWVDELLVCKQRYAALAQGDSCINDSEMLSSKGSLEISQVIKESLTA